MHPLPSPLSPDVARSLWPVEEVSAGPLAPPRFEWAAWRRSVRQHAWVILALVVAATALAAAYAQTLDPVYRSTTTLLIESGKAKILSIEEVYNAVSQDREYYQTQVEILRSRDVALRTVRATRLWEQPEFDPRRPPTGALARLRAALQPSAAPAAWTDERLADAAVGGYMGALSVEPVRLSQLVKISFESRDAALAARVAEASAASFIESDRDARLKLNLSVTGQLQERLAALRDKLLQSENALQQFRERTGLVRLDGSHGIAGQQLADISQRLVAARVRRTELESAYQQVARSEAGAEGRAPAALNQPGLAEARARVAQAALALEEVSRTLGEHHGRVVEARSALEATQRQLQQQTQAVIAGLQGEMQAARETERALAGALAAARTTVQGVNRQEFELGVLEREVETNKQLYELLLSRTKETSVSSNLQAAVARIVDHASPAAAPLHPNKPQIVLSAFLLALLAGSGGAIVAERARSTLRSSEEAESHLRLPVLAALPALPPAQSQGAARTFVDQPRSRHANAIRDARTSMVLAKLDSTHRLVLVTSALPGEGKTTFCTNLAFAHAQTKRTLLIDADLRQPQVAQRLGLPPHARGLTDLLLHGADVKDCVHSVVGSALLVMPAGPPPDSPDDLLLSPHLREVLASLAKRVDIVLIDSPALDTCADALILAQQANDTIYVVKADETPQLTARKGLDQLRRAGASVLGLVISNVPAPPQRAPRPPRRGGPVVPAEDSRLDERHSLWT